MLAPQQLSVLIEKIGAGTATPEEVRQFNEWYHSFDDSQAEVYAAEGETEAATAAKIRLAIMATLHQTPAVTKTSPYRRWRLPAAAAVVLLIVLAVFFKFSADKKPAVATVPLPSAPAVAAVTDLKPGGNKAVLTLANNTQVILDSASNGVISTQGNIQIQKLSNGQLAYTINGKQVTENDEAFYNTITTPRGGQYQVTLADGTKVWLNAQSSIRFPVMFTGSERRVEITGEAYFEVAKNPAMPFKVKAAASEVEVLGTHFNINAYENEHAIKTTLVEGRVKVGAAGAQQLLLPGQQSAIQKNGRIVIDQHADTEEALAWKDGKFRFKSADLKSILRQVERWYDADVEYRGNVNLHFTGRLPRADNVSKLFEKLQLTGEVHFKIEGRKIIVSH